MGIENSSYVIYNDIIMELGKKANKLDVKNGGGKNSGVRNVN